MKLSTCLFLILFGGLLISASYDSGTTPKDLMVKNPFKHHGYEFWKRDHYDQTDQIGDTEKLTQVSGLRVYVDWGTGTEYLYASSGALTPRLDKNGHVMHIKEEGLDAE